MVTKHDSGFEAWPGEADRIALAICPLIAAVYELTADGTAERKAALIEVLESAERVRRALAPAPRLN